MARRSPVKVGLVLALVFVFSYGQADDTCRTGCHGASRTFKYHEGTTYKYNFDSKIQVSLSSAEGQQSTTEVKATVLLTQQPQCNQVIRLQNVQVIGNDGKKHANIPDVDKPIRINFHDGHLEDSICATPGDSQNSLNLKRAIASIFQANLKSGHETDVFGLCHTEVAQHKEGNILVIQKSRNLNRCAYRESIKQDFLATAFNLNSEIKSSPILNGDYDAKLRVKNGILDQATVHENYLYVPFSVGNNGAKASVETVLKYVGTAKDNAQVQVSQPRSIIFEDPHDVNSPHASVNSILTAVRQVAKTIDVVVGENTAKEFLNLVKILRVSKKDDLLAVYSQVKAGVGFPDKVAAKKIFLDALLRAGNGDDIEVAIELLKNKELDEVEEHLVYLGLSTVRHATENSISSAAALFNQPHLPRVAYLGIGNLAGRFCRQHSCENVAAINSLTETLISKLGNGKATNRQQENDLVFVLKALANIRHLNDKVLAKITAIAQDKKAPNRVRVTALETFLADPCKDKLRDSAITILKDIQQDSEIRIKAYLALAQCPNNKVGNAVKTLLETEPSYQVGGFIVTHIRNLRASANPDKQLAKQHLGLINVPKRFPFDLRKYSANGEFSYTVDSIGVANSIETNVIYSQSSFLPRSTSLNLTAEVFGHNFNFLEIETRQENLDRLVEHYFGPKGLFRANNVQELWQNSGEETAHAFKKLHDRVRDTLRSRRDLSKGEIDYINKQVQIRTNELNTDLDLDLSVKSFGSEILFLNVNDDVRKFTPDVLIDHFVQGLTKGLDSLKHFEKTLRANLILLDAEFAYPTSSGFPLRLGVEGTSNLQVKASGAIDVRALLKDDTTVKVSLIPSANVEVTGRFTVDTQVVESGLKVISTLYTATGGDLIISNTNHEVDVKFSLPVEKQTLVSATHDIVFHTREWGAAEANHPLKFAQNKDFSICLDQLSEFIGLTFCGEYTGPNLQGEKVPILPFPLSGDAKFAVTIEKEDLSHYHFKEAIHAEHNHIGLEYLLEAVAKNGQKKVSLAAAVGLEPDIFAKVSLTSPSLSGLAEARLSTSEQGKALTVRFVQNQDEYYGKIGIAIVNESPTKSTYKPVMEYKTPENSGIQLPPYRVEGQVIYEHEGLKSVYTLDHVKLVIPDQKTITLNGQCGRERDTIFSDMTLSDGSNNAAFKAKFQFVEQGYQYSAEFKNSVSPQGNIRLKGELSRITYGYKHFFQVAHGGDFSDKNNILTMENSLKSINKGPQDFLIGTENKLTYPALTTDLQFDFELKPQAVQYTVNIQYTNVKLGSELQWEYTNKHDGTNFKLDFGLWGLNNRLSLKSQRTVTGDQSQVENSLDINGKRLEVNGKVKHHVRPQDIDLAADLIVKVPNHNTPFNVVSGLKVNPNEFDVSHKVTSGSTVYVDVFLKVNRAGNANGSIKVNLKGDLVINGHVKANRGSGNGEVVIELPAVKRVSKIDTTFTIHEPTYNVIVNIYPIFNQDKTKKVTLSTQTSLPHNTIDSKNFIDVFGEKLEVNVKGSQQGEVTNGKTVGEVEVTLPNQHYFAGKLNREIKSVNNVLNGNVVASVEHRAIKNQPGNKVTLKGQFRDVKPDENIYDLSYQLLAEKSDGRNLNVDLNAKRQVHGDVTTVEFTNKIYGSELASPIESVFKSSCKQVLDGSFEVSSSYAPLGKASIAGKHQLSGQPLSGEVTVDVSTTSQSIRTLKVTLGGSVLNKESVVVKGNADIFADAPQGVIVQVTTSGEVISSDSEARIKGTIKSGNGHPISVDAGLTRSDNKDDKEVKGDVTLNYGENQKVTGDFNLVHVSAREYKLDARLDTPVEKFKTNRIQVHTKRNEDDTRYQSEVIYTTNGKTWTSNTDLFLSEITPSVEIKVTCPEGKLRHLLVKVTKLSDRQLGGQLKIVNQKNNFLLEGTLDANFESVDDFHLKITANSPALKIDKYVIEAHNKPAKAGRRIQVTAKSGNKNILAGSTSYTAREEHGKLIVEGSGSFKLHEKTQSANFKYIRQNLSQSKNGETGIEISFDAGLGNQAVDAELKITNKQFRILNSYCEEKKSCAHVEIDVKTSADDPDYFNQEIEIAVDLRKLGLSHEFGLKAVTTRKQLVLDHTIDVHFQSAENSKYQYSLYVHPKEAGVSLTTPRRVVCLESNVNVPEGFLQNGGRLTGEVVFYSDKRNQPNKKSGLIAFLDLNARTQSVVGEARFTNPVLKRPLVVALQSKATPVSFDFTTTADVFTTPDQKLVVSYKAKWTDVHNTKQFKGDEVFEIKGSNLHLNILYEDWGAYDIEQNKYELGVKFVYTGHKNKYESLYSYEVTPKKALVVLDVFNVHLYRVESQLQLSQNHQIVDSVISCYGHKPLTSHIELKNWNTLKYTLSSKDKPQDKLQVNAAFIPGQIADFRTDVIKGGAPHELVHATLKLDEANFLKSDYNVHAKNVEELFLKRVKAAIQAEGEELKKLSEKISADVEDELTHLSELAKHGIASLTPIQKYYSDELHKIKEEILADKTIKEASEFLYNIIAAVSQAFGETFSQFNHLLEDLAVSFQNTFGKILEAIQKDLWPKTKIIGEKIVNLVVEVVDSATEIVITITAKAAEIAEKYRPELQQLAAVAGEVGEDVLRAAINVFEAVRSVLADQWEQVYNEVKNLPVVEQLKAEYQRIAQHGLPTPEVLAKSVQDLLATFRDLAPTNELKELIQAISDYITKKLSNQAVDDKAAIDRIVKAATASVKHLVGAAAAGDPSSDLQNVKVPVPTSVWNQLPKVAPVRLSPVSYLLGEEPLPVDFWLSLVNKPRNWIPPFPLYGLVAQGQHIFTFDGKHLTFPGQCNYLLARDAVDGNFTIIGSYSNGILNAISLSQGSDVITLKKHGQVLVNNAPAELPARKPNIAAYRDTERIVLVSSFGVRVICGPELVVCSVTASGFYHGKLRGLLGNGNNEPYDDFALPNGKIVSSESEFGNSYKTTAGCGAVQTVSHHSHHSVPSCDKLFGWESSFRYCYPFVSTDNFKMACEHGVAAGVKDTEHAIAVAYVAACNQHGIPVLVPSEYVKCTNGDKPTSLGDQFSVKTPGKAADVVVLVDTSKGNEPTYKEYVQPLIQQLTSELTTKGINDLEFHIIAYAGDNHWPSHITSNGGKLTFKGKAPNLKFAENPEEEPLLTGDALIDGLIHFIEGLGDDLDLAFGLDLQALTYTEGLQYPFRANAIKTIIAVTGRPCKVGRFYPLQLLRTLLYRGKDINLNLITPISRSGAKAEAKNIVGFNARNVYALGQTKNKIKHFADLGKELAYDDYCIDFTVQNDGNVFVSDHIQLQPKGTRKQFVQVTSHAIVEQVLGAEKSYECECKYVTPYTAANVCKVVSVKEKPQARKVGTKS